MRSTNPTLALTVLAALAAANAVLAQPGKPQTTPPQAASPKAAKTQPAAQPAPAARLAPQPATNAAPATARFAVVLDPAHGGDDAGAKLASGQPEKALTLSLASRLRAQLAAHGYAVAATRDQDQAVDPIRRAELANRQTAQACLSLHAADAGAGIRLYVSSLVPAQPGQSASAWRTGQSAWISQSLALAGNLNAALQKAGFPVTLGRMPLAALDSMNCPAVAIEISPVRNADRKPTLPLESADYQRRLLDALAAALASWRSEAARP